jgi:hypothetical protein
VLRVLREMSALGIALISEAATVLGVELPSKLEVVVLAIEMAVPRALAALGLVLV